jgi:hypothetical protein
VGIEVEHDLFLGLELEHVVATVLGLQSLVVRHSRLQPQISLLCRCDQREVHILIPVLLPFLNLHLKHQLIDVVLGKFNVPIRRYLSITRIFLCDLLLIEYVEHKLVDRRNQVEGDVLLGL